MVIASYFSNNGDLDIQEKLETHDFDCNQNHNKSIKKIKPITFSPSEYSHLLFEDSLLDRKMIQIFVFDYSEN